MHHSAAHSHRDTQNRADRLVAKTVYHSGGICRPRVLQELGFLVETIRHVGHSPLSAVGDVTTSRCSR